MDTTQTTHLSLCSGYGGIDLGLRRAIPDLRTIAYAEIEAFAVENLLARMEGGALDPAPVWPDLKSFPWESFRDRVDILSGGYPCQPFSAAGKRLGGEDPRHLWPYIADGIRLLRPKFCFFENVEGHITLGLREVIADLGRLGYTATWGIFSARECGAPHQRKRVFILADRDCQRGQLSNWWRKSAEQMLVSNGKERGAWPSRPGEPQHSWEPPRVVGNADSPRSQEWTGQRGTRLQGTHANGGTDAERQAQPALGGDADGATRGMDYAKLCVSCDNRTDELRLLGNGVVPATATLAFRTLLQEIISA